MVKTPEEIRASYKTRKQNQSFAVRGNVRPPRTKNLRTAIAYDKNRQKKPSTMAKYRYGYNLAWKVKGARERLLQLGFKAPGTYPMNQQSGVMFSMPYDIPKAFGDEDAGWICRESAQSKDPKYTKSQMEAIRAMLSYAYQLQTGTHPTKKVKPNYPSVSDQWGCQKSDSYAPPTKQTRSSVSVEPSGLKTAFTTEWTLKSGMNFMLWIVGCLATWHWSILGNRCKTDINKIKNSPKHEIIPSEGWMSSVMLGGRSKLPNATEPRPWKAYCVCLCPGGKHQPPPKGWDRWENLDQHHNPIEISWPTTCPLNCFQIIRSYLPADDLRTFPEWLSAQHRYGARNMDWDTVIDLAKRWLNVQGANPDNRLFDRNSGRKALGKVCDEYGIPYEESVEIHGDLYCTWKTYYQTGLRKRDLTTPRTQSRNPEVATAPLRRIARAFGRGRLIREDPKDFDLRQIGQLLTANLRAMGKADVVAQILDKT